MSKGKLSAQTFQNEYEKLFVKMKLSNFEPKKTEAWKRLTERFGDKISGKGLGSLAHVISEKLNIELDREYKRRKNTLIIWFDEHLDQIWPFIESHIGIIDESWNEL